MNGTASLNTAAAAVATTISSVATTTTANQSLSSIIHWSMNEKIVIAISYGGSIILSSSGNIMVIIVFRAGSLRNRKNRQSDIRQFLINLAISDLLISIFCLPFTFTYILLWHWPFPGLLCPLVLAIQVTSVTASAVTNMVIGLDRFWVVIYPMKSRITRNKSGTVIALIWGLSGLYAIPQLIVGRSSINDQGVRDCDEKWNSLKLQFSYTIFLLVTTYVLPLVVLTATYSIVGVTLWRRNLPGEADEVRDANHNRSKIKVLKMLAIIVVCFCLCWMPLHLFFVVGHVTQFENYSKYYVNIWYVACHWIAMANSFVNPLLYTLMNDSFQDDLRWIINKCCCMLPPIYNDLSVVTTQIKENEVKENNDKTNKHRPSSDIPGTESGLTFHTKHKSLTSKYSIDQNQPMKRNSAVEQLDKSEMHKDKYYYKNRGALITTVTVKRDSNSNNQTQPLLKQTVNDNNKQYRCNDISDKISNKTATSVPLLPQPPQPTAAKTTSTLINETWVNKSAIQFVTQL